MKYWRTHDKDGNLVRLDMNPHQPPDAPDAIEITDKQYHAYIAALPYIEPPDPEPEPPVAPQRLELDTILKHLDDLDARIQDLQYAIDRINEKLLRIEPT